MTAYDSIKAGFEDFLTHQLDGRPFVVIGDSQGAAMLNMLLARLVDDVPALRSRLVTAIILGGNVEVPAGQLVGGTFKHIPACSRLGETGCVIAYSSFPSTPPADSLFGRPGQGVSLYVGVDAVARACQQAAVCRAELRLVVTSPAVRRLLAAEGLDRLVPVYSSLAAAIAAGEPDGPDPRGDLAPPIVVPRWPARSQDGQENGPRSAPLNEAVLRQLIDALADGIVLAGEDGRIVLANRRAAEMFGYRPAELAGQLVESLMPAGLREAHRVDRASYALKPVARPMADRARLVGLRRDGSTIPVTVTLSPVPTASGHFVLAVVRDATHERGQDDLIDLVAACSRSRPSTPKTCWTGLSAACSTSGSAWTQPQTSPLSWPGSGSAMRSSGWTRPSTRSAIMSSGPGAPVAATGRPGDMLS